MPGDNIPDFIQTILDKNKGFMKLSDLPQHLRSSIRQQLCIKSRTALNLLRKKIEAASEDRFMFHSKGRTLYILTPCEPEELVMSSLSPDKPQSIKSLAKSLPFSLQEIRSLVNSLISEGHAKITLTEKLEPQITTADFKVAGSQADYELGESLPSSQPAHDERYTPAKFKEAFDACDKGRIFVRICDIRRRLNWPRDIFDEVLRSLRDDGTVQLHVGDASIMTPDEVEDCFIDENNFRMGTVTWHGR